MAIAIPAIVDTQLATLKATMLPHAHVDGGSATHTEAAGSLFPLGNRMADMLRLLTGLIDTGTLVVTGTHGATDAADVNASPTAVGQATADTMADAMKTAYNLHHVKVAGSVHGNAGDANTVAAAGSDGTEGTLVTLVNDIRAKLILHMANVAASVHAVADPNVVTLAACTDLASAIILINHLKAIYNAHCINIKGVSIYGIADQGAFTGVNSLIGVTVTLAGNITTALAGVKGVVASNTTGIAYFTTPLVAAPQTGDNYSVEFTAVDADLAVIDGGKGMGGSQSNPYGYGPSLLNAIIKLIAGLGGVVPAYLLRTTDAVTHHVTYDPAEAFGFGSPHAGGSTGHGGGYLLAAGLQLVRDTVAAYTKPTA